MVQKRKGRSSGSITSRLTSGITSAKICKKGQLVPIVDRRKPIIISIAAVVIMAAFVAFLFLGKQDLGERQFAGQAVAIAGTKTIYHYNLNIYDGTTQRVLGSPSSYPRNTDPDPNPVNLPQSNPIIVNDLDDLFISNLANVAVGNGNWNDRIKNIQIQSLNNKNTHVVLYENINYAGLARGFKSSISPGTSQDLQDFANKVSSLKICYDCQDADSDGLADKWDNQDAGISFELKFSNSGNELSFNSATAGKTITPAVGTIPAVVTFSVPDLSVFSRAGGTWDNYITDADMSVSSISSGMQAPSIMFVLYEDKNYQGAYKYVTDLHLRNSDFASKASSMRICAGGCPSVDTDGNGIPDILDDGDKDAITDDKDAKPWGEHSSKEGNAFICQEGYLAGTVLGRTSCHYIPPGCTPIKYAEAFNFVVRESASSAEQRYITSTGVSANTFLRAETSASANSEFIFVNPILNSAHQMDKNAIMMVPRNSGSTSVALKNKNGRFVSAGASDSLPTWLVTMGDAEKFGANLVSKAGNAYQFSVDIASPQMLCSYNFLSLKSGTRFVSVKWSAAELGNIKYDAANLDRWEVLRVVPAVSTQPACADGVDAFKYGDQIMLKSHKGTYLASTSSNFNAHAADAQAFFKIKKADALSATDPVVLDGFTKIALQASNNKYLTALDDSNWNLKSDAASVGDPQKFLMSKTGNTPGLCPGDAVAIYSKFNKYVVVENDGSTAHADRTDADSWERFVLEKAQLPEPAPLTCPAGQLAIGNTCYSGGSVILYSGPNGEGSSSALQFQYDAATISGVWKSWRFVSDPQKQYVVTLYENSDYTGNVKSFKVDKSTTYNQYDVSNFPAKSARRCSDCWMDQDGDQIIDPYDKSCPSVYPQIDYDSSFYIKTWKGYLQVIGNRATTVATSASATRFKFGRVGAGSGSLNYGNRVSLKLSDGRLLSVALNKVDLEIVAANSALNGYRTFLLGHPSLSSSPPVSSGVPCSTFKFHLKTQLSPATFLSVEEDSSLYADAPAPADWETFTLEIPPASSENCQDLTGDSDGDTFIAKRDVDCHRQTCEAEKKVTWSNIVTQGAAHPVKDQQHVPDRIGCCQPTQCVKADAGCVDYDYSHASSYVCGNENDFLECTASKSTGLLSDGKKYYCSGSWQKCDAGKSNQKQGNFVCDPQGSNPAADDADDYKWKACDDSMANKKRGDYVCARSSAQSEYEWKKCDGTTSGQKWGEHHLCAGSPRAWQVCDASVNPAQVTPITSGANIFTCTATGWSSASATEAQAAQCTEDDSVTVYVDNNYAGVNKQYCSESSATLANAVSAKVSSIKLGKNVEYAVFSDGSNILNVGASVANLADASYNYNNKANSVRVIKFSAGTQNAVTLFKDKDGKNYLASFTADTQDVGTHSNKVQSVVLHGDIKADLLSTAATPILQTAYASAGEAKNLNADLNKKLKSIDISPMENCMDANGNIDGDNKIASEDEDCSGRQCHVNNNLWRWTYTYRGDQITANPPERSQGTLNIFCCPSDTCADKIGYTAGCMPAGVDTDKVKLCHQNTIYTCDPTGIGKGKTLADNSKVVCTVDGWGEEVCNDNIDNDQDGKKDCKDSYCNKKQGDGGICCATDADCSGGLVCLSDTPNGAKMCVANPTSQGCTLLGDYDDNGITKPGLDEIRFKFHKLCGQLSCNKNNCGAQGEHPCPVGDTGKYICDDGRGLANNGLGVCSIGCLLGDYDGNGITKPGLDEIRFKFNKLCSQLSCNKNDCGSSGQSPCAIGDTGKFICDNGIGLTTDEFAVCL